MSQILRFLPKNFLSCLVGHLAEMRLPQPLAKWTVQAFARAVKIQVDQAALPLEHYRTVAEFFVRDLKPGLRPLPAEVEGQLLSPVDGTLRALGPINELSLELIKGKNYSVKSLIHEEAWAARFKGGYFYNFYLSPADCHHVYSPLSAEIVHSYYIPGKLWPVNDWALRNIEGLFGVNERLITYLQSSFGLVAVVMVGATNVGKLRLAYNQHRLPEKIKAGDKLGTFHMGSAVILLCENGRLKPKLELLGGGPLKVCYGQSIGSLAD